MFLRLEIILNYLKKYLNFKAKYIVWLTGTSALHLAMILSGLQKGDEVLMPSPLFATAIQQYIRASPHFVDVKKALSIDFEKLNVHLSKFKFRGNIFIIT